MPQPPQLVRPRELEWALHDVQPPALVVEVVAPLRRSSQLTLWEEEVGPNPFLSQPAPVLQTSALGPWSSRLLPQKEEEEEEEEGAAPPPRSLRLPPEFEKVSL